MIYSHYEVTDDDKTMQTTDPCENNTKTKSKNSPESMGTGSFYSEVAISLNHAKKNAKHVRSNKTVREIP